MKGCRIFVEKKEGFRVEAESLLAQFNENLSMSLNSLRLLNVYDLFGFTNELVEKCRYSVFGERVTDNVFDTAPAMKKYIAVEFIPGQFDQRASSAVDCVHLIDPAADVEIKSSRLLVFEDSVSEEQLAAIRHYFINPVECRIKNLDILSLAEKAEIKAMEDLAGFIKMEPAQYQAFCRSHGLAMNADDLGEVVNYFRKEGRDPLETELRILDTYWSDHCRHTTFTTNLTEITIDESFIKNEIENTLGRFHKIRKELGRGNKSLCLMELATIGARYLSSTGKLDNLERSEENNACSIFINVDVDGQDEKWLLQFKNETHNHPTEIEPFGGASTCLGGAIRDPLSGRAYVYQAMRVTGAGDITAAVDKTLAGKLPQRIISQKAAAGYSSYGNQIGLATTCVREIFDEGYVAKRMEVGAVVAAVKAENVRRETPAPGDVILLLGGRTGRDGIGGATGASKEHTESSLETCGSEVQKGNAPVERQLQRLFRRSEVTRLIKKSNDFGAGGVSVAIGELADGLDIRLDKVPVKYSGLNSTELAISESQERMALVVEAKDREKFESYCNADNVEVTYVADVTSTGRMRIFNGEKLVCDLSREFIDSAGAKHYSKAAIQAVENVNPFAKKVDGAGIDEKMHNLLAEPNVASQKGLVEMFDSTIGRSTVVMPYGGAKQSTEAQASVQKLPVNGFTNTASVMAFGYNPQISKWSPYHGAAYSVVEACAKVVSTGADWSGMRFSYQEYFERMTANEHSWGKPLSALLGALKMQLEFGLPSIGGKDSMSGTFEDLNVPPTLIAFGITSEKVGNIISPEFKKAGNYVYVIRHKALANYMPDTDMLKCNWDFTHSQILQENIVSAWSVSFGGVAEGLAKMAFGNGIGARIYAPESELFNMEYGSLIVESVTPLGYENAVLLGRTIPEAVLEINAVPMELDALYSCNLSRYENVYPSAVEAKFKGKLEDLKVEAVSGAAENMKYRFEAVEHPVVCLPVFPGSNCDYDTAKALRKAGAQVNTFIFRNLTEQDVLNSIDGLAQQIEKSHILAFCGGFSSGDEPDGSGKFIAAVINNAKVGKAIENFLHRDGLIIGICNGFQALVKSGLLPYGKLGCVSEDSPTLFRNDINRHISQMTTTKVASVNSPWLAGLELGQEHTIAISHGEGKFVVNEDMARKLFEAGQVAFRYVENPNGSYYDIEGILSPDGHILGKMGHTERYEEGNFKNISGNLYQPLFDNAVKYFRKEMGE